MEGVQNNKFAPKTTVADNMIFPRWIVSEKKLTRQQEPDKLPRFLLDIHTGFLREVI